MFNFFEKFVEFLAMIKIALSPILVFSIAAFFLYHSSVSYGLMLCIGSLIVGLVLGIYLAVRISKKKGAVNFLSRLSATPELDKNDEK